MDKNVFITGAGGYIGSLTVASLAEIPRDSGQDHSR